MTQAFLTAERTRYGARRYSAGLPTGMLAIQQAEMPAIRHVLRTSDLGPRTSDFRLRTSNLGPRTSDLELQTSDFGLRTSDFRQADFRQADFRQADFRQADFRQAAFSLIEIMVTVGLLSFIILGLVAVFSQTQRAFTTSMAQTDVLENGRAVADMLAREISEMAPSHTPFVANFTNAVNLLGFPEPILQDLPGTDHDRTNIIERFFFLSKMGQQWTAHGYEVVPLFPNAGVGSLYRFAWTTNRYRLGDLHWEFDRAILGARMTNRLAEGIVHLRVRPVAANGYPLEASSAWTNAVFRTNAVSLGVRAAQNTEARLAIGNGAPDLVNYRFTSNAVPAYVELELGILEPQAIERLKAIGTASPDVQRNYLSNRVGQVHIFRQRIPIRNVDPSVYQ